MQLLITHIDGLSFPYSHQTAVPASKMDWFRRASLFERSRIAASVPYRMFIWLRDMDRQRKLEQYPTTPRIAQVNSIDLNRADRMAASNAGTLARYRQFGTDQRMAYLSVRQFNMNEHCPR